MSYLTFNDNYLFQIISYIDLYWFTHCFTQIVLHKTITSCLYARK